MLLSYWLCIWSMVSTSILYKHCLSEIILTGCNNRFDFKLFFSMFKMSKCLVYFLNIIFKQPVGFKNIEKILIHLVSIPWRWVNNITYSVLSISFLTKVAWYYGKIFKNIYWFGLNVANSWDFYRTPFPSPFHSNKFIEKL